MDDHASSEHTGPQSSTTTGRQRRRPPSLSEQRNRTERIAPWADTWKLMRLQGRWK